MGIEGFGGPQITNITFLVDRHLGYYNTTPQLRCASPDNRIVHIVNQTFLHIAQDSEIYFTCPYKQDKQFDTNSRVTQNS